MKFEQRLKIRFWVAVSYIVLGMVMIPLFWWVFPHEMLSTMGFAIMVVGVARLRNHFRITKNKETLRKREIAETDERNITIMDKSRSITFLLSILLFCVGILVFHLLGKSLVADVLSGCVCLMLVIYWVTYCIVSKKI